MSQYWLHVNHPNDKARIHVAAGCKWVRDAVARVRVQHQKINPLHRVPATSNPSPVPRSCGDRTCEKI